MIVPAPKKLAAAITHVIREHPDKDQAASK
jgi:hypothetical protein